MKLFQARDLHIPAITIIADDMHHASHILLMALYNGLKHWPKAEYTIGDYVPVKAKQTEPMIEWAQSNQPGIVHRCNDGGWELIAPRDSD